MIGTALAHYRILDRLGAGGMGEVYLAEDTRLGRRVAVKVLPPELAADPERLRRLEREARLLASLNHPHVVTVHSVEEADGVRFLTMELVEGSALSELVSAGGLPVDRLLALAVPIADALAAAHGRGIVHRDLKPANVMVTRDGAVKVVDFGLATLHQWRASSEDSALDTRTLERMTGQGQVLGTLPYMAPEQLQGKPADARSDIFALGVTLFEMATGARPFAAESPMETASSILRDAAPSLLAARPDAPRHLDRIVQHCLAKDPERRYQSAQDVRNELASLRAEREAEGAPVAPAPPPATERRPSRRPAAAGIALLLGALAVAGGALLLRRDPPEPIGSVAVLPFANASGEAELDYLGHGLAETLIHRLSKVEELRVAPRALSFRYGGRHADPLAAAEELGVRSVVSGRVRVVGDDVVVAAELTDAREVAQSWGATYRRPRSDLLALQEELSLHIARELRLQLSPQERRQVAEGETDDAEAFELYLKARHHARAYVTDRDRLGRAAEYARAAIERDPGYASAHATLSLVYSFLGLWELEPPEEVLPLARRAAERALELAPSLADSQLARGFAQWLTGGDRGAAEVYFRRALELDPGDPRSQALFSYFLTSMGRASEAVAHARQATELDPLSPEALSALAWARYCAGPPEAAVAAMDALLEVDPAAVWASNFRPGALARAGRGEEALAAAAERCRERGAEPSHCFRYAEVLAILGRREEAAAITRRIELEPRERAAIAALSGDRREALAALQEVRQEGSLADLLFLQGAPEWQPLRGDPAFQALIRSLGLSAANGSPT